MSEVQAAAAIVGCLLPLIVALLKQTGWPKWANTLVAMAASVGAGVVTAWGSGTFTSDSVLVAAATVFAAATATYQLFFRDMDVLERASERTSFVKAESLHRDVQARKPVKNNMLSAKEDPGNPPQAQQESDGKRVGE